MTRMTAAAVLFCTATFASASAWAQEQTMSPPKVLEIQREAGKFGRDADHQRNEMAYVQAVTAAKSQTHYFAAVSTSGSGEAWFIVPHDSWAAYEKSVAAEQQEPLKTQLARVMDRDAEFVSNGSTWLAAYDEKSSYHANVNIAGMRYFEAETIRVRAGHDNDWGELAKLYISTLDKANLDVHYALYNVVYGAPAGTVLIFSPHKSLAELDSQSANFGKFTEALGPDGQKRMGELEAAAIQADVSNLYTFDPKMSYPPQEWVQADPFWKQARAMAKGAGMRMPKKAAAAPPASKP